MTHVSRKRLDSSTKSLLDSLTISAFSNLNRSDLPKIVNIVLSETEQTMLEKRLGIILLLALEYKAEEIARITKTTVQTVARIRLTLQLTPAKDKKMLLARLKKAFTKEQIKNFASNLDISYSNFKKS